MNYEWTRLHHNRSYGEMRLPLPVDSPQPSLLLQPYTLFRYVADETPMASYLNVHTILNRRREEAARAAPGTEGSNGPVVAVVGPTDSGKSTLCRMLCNWAVRSGWQPTFVDLDVGG